MAKISPDMQTRGGDLLDAMGMDPYDSESSTEHQTQAFGEMLIMRVYATCGQSPNRYNL